MLNFPKKIKPLHILQGIKIYLKSNSISRVLNLMIIYLWLCITAQLKPSVVNCRADLISRLMLLRMGFTREFSYHLPCELLPHISTIAKKLGIYFLLHYPWSRLHRVLPGTLLYGARTFLTHFHARNHLNYFFIIYHFK